MNFFDKYPRFYETSKTGPGPNRLNRRYKAIFETDPSVFKDATVLDISSHDGRWSFAALSQGARHVTGVEPRKHHVDNANATLSELGVAADRFEFVRADVFEYLKKPVKFDVVMCLGFFYHTYRHPELVKLIKNCEPKIVIVDSQVLNAEGKICAVRADEAGREFEAVPEASSYKGKTFVAMPTYELLAYFFETFDFKVEKVDWNAILSDGNTSGVKDYAEQRRATFIGRVVS